MSNDSVHPLVSIVTPNYNYGHFLRGCLESIAAQTYPRIELVVMDGGSTDNSLDLIREFERAGVVTRWVSEKDNGQTDAINKGFARCTGQIFAWLNADDRYAHPDVIAEVVEHYRQGARFISGEFQTIKENGEPSLAEQAYGTSQPCDFRQLLRFWETICPPQPATFVDRELAAKVFPLDERVECYMDYQLFLGVLAQSPPVVWTQHRWVHFIIHGNNKSLGNYTDAYNWESECRRVFAEAARQLPPAEQAQYFPQFEESIILRSFKSHSLTANIGRACRRRPGLLFKPAFWKAAYRKFFPRKMVP